MKKIPFSPPDITEEEIEKFTEDQKRFLERKNKKIEELRKKQMESITKEIELTPIEFRGLTVEMDLDELPIFAE